MFYHFQTGLQPSYYTERFYLTTKRDIYSFFCWIQITLWRGQIYQICQKIRVNLESGAAKSLCSQHEVIWVEVK